ncbi:MAG: nuclear transport factor 2 family protein [Ktedonobacteraceae bacterium]|nr:nuclear transport factor 2 family protein [Ktedonobacteraceae bacterium]
MQETAGEMFYYRLSSAIEAQDLATLQALYHPDATLISLRTGQIVQGRAAIMATIKETLAVASPIKPIAIESFVELDDIIGVEATQSTRFTQNRQTYDIYVLQAGVIRNHFSGMIAPRQPAPPLHLGAPATPEQHIHRRYWTAIEAQNLAQLRTLYHPDAISISVSFGSVTQGYDPFENHLQQEMREWGPSRLKALTRFIEDSNLICTEGTRTIDIDPGMSLSRVPLDLQFYNIFLLRAGVICLAFGGLISPRPTELKETLKLVAERRRKGVDMVWDAFITSRRRWRV